LNSFSNPTEVARFFGNLFQFAGVEPDALDPIFFQK